MSTHLAARQMYLIVSLMTFPEHFGLDYILTLHFLSTVDVLDVSRVLQIWTVVGLMGSRICIVVSIVRPRLFVLPTVLVSTCTIVLFWYILRV